MQVSQSKVHAYRWQFIEHLRSACPTSIAWQRYTMTVAIVLAETLGADVITLYGCEWQGTRDWDGATNLRNEGRDAHRWRAEEDATRLIAQWMIDDGVSLRRVRDDGSIEELHDMAKKTEETIPSPPQTETTTATEAASPPKSTAPGGTYNVKLRLERRLGQEECPPGHLLARVELYPPFIDVQSVARLVCDDVAVVTFD